MTASVQLTWFSFRHFDGCNSQRPEIALENAMGLVIQFQKFKTHPTAKHRQQLQCSNIQGQVLSNTVSESHLLAEFKTFGLEVD